MLNVFLYLNKEEKWKQTTGQDEDENMKIIETYGNYIEKWSNENPGRARWLLKTGWKAQNLKFRFAPDKRLMPAEQYLARLMMDTMIRPLECPEESAIVSIFTPCEILQEAGLHPYNVEGFSCYLSASKAVYNRRRIRAYPRHFAVITRHLSERRRRKYFRNQSVLYTRI